MGHLKTWTNEYGDELIAFYREAVRTRSYSDEEGAYAEKILQKMMELGYDESYIDQAGNVVGRVGNGPSILHFDSHMDTVQVNDEEGWKAPPFEAHLYLFSGSGERTGSVA